MTKRPLIGITCGTSSNDPNSKTEQDRLNSAYSRAVSEAGGIPVILPNVANSMEVLDRIDGLLLSGGADVAPTLYGERSINKTVEVDSERDSAEIPLISEAMRRNMPILGICRGIQSLGVALGGSLIQDLPSQKPSEIKHRQSGSRSVRTHAIEVKPGTILAGILRTTRLDVNTLHHQALKDVPDSLTVSAVAPDGTIEGVEIPEKRFVLAVQFHPEEMVEKSEEARNLFNAFIHASMNS